jgi:isochorismate synthase
MSSFAIFRLPHANHCTLIEGEVQTLSSLTDLNGRQGFVIAPFVVTEETPILLIEQKRSTPLQTLPVREGSRYIKVVSARKVLSPLPYREGTGESLEGSEKSLDSLYPFSTFHSALLAGHFQKLVLARCAIEPNDVSVEPITLFERACEHYPRMFIALVSTPQSGTWLTATPEVLLESLPQPGLMRTIALAGTMRLHDDELDGEGLHLRWSTKNIQEQRYVASYIADTLKRLGIDYEEEGPRTVRAANLVHLRSDFTFGYDSTHAGNLLEALHPTPAVCGLPKKEAQAFILQNEPTPRQYYSGFMGPLHLPLTTHHSPPVTHLYVSLRCMQIEDDCYRLYAGGGLLRDSTFDKEWQETEAKMETMRQIINHQ